EPEPFLPSQRQLRDAVIPIEAKDLVSHSHPSGRALLRAPIDEQQALAGRIRVRQLQFRASHPLAVLIDYSSPTRGIELISINRIRRAARNRWRSTHKNHVGKLPQSLYHYIRVTETRALGIVIFLRCVADCKFGRFQIAFELLLKLVGSVQKLRPALRE